MSTQTQSLQLKAEANQAKQAERRGIIHEVRCECERFLTKLQQAQLQNETAVDGKSWAALKRSAADLKLELTHITFQRNGEPDASN